MTLTADVPLLPSDVDADLSRELLSLIERDPDHIAAQLRAWMAEEAA